MSSSGTDQVIVFDGPGFRCTLPGHRMFGRIAGDIRLIRLPLLIGIVAVYLTPRVGPFELLTSGHVHQIR